MEVGGRRDGNLQCVGVSQKIAMCHRGHKRSQCVGGGGGVVELFSLQGWVLKIQEFRRGIENVEGASLFGYVNCFCSFPKLQLVQNKQHRQIT